MSSDGIDRTAVAARHGLPAEVAEQLHGSTAAEVEADAAARAAIATMFGRKAEPTEPEPATAPSLAGMSDEQLVERQQALAAERERRRHEAAEQAAGAALVRAMHKPRHQALIDALHGGDDRD